MQGCVYSLALGKSFDGVGADTGRVTLVSGLIRSHAIQRDTVLTNAVLSAGLHPSNDLKVSILFKHSLRVKNLHVVVALEEVGGLGFAVLGVGSVARGSGAAQIEFILLGQAERAALVGVEQMLKSVLSVKSLHFY